MVPPDQRNMAIGRGVLTEGERSYLRGEESDQRLYEARSRVKTRINGPLAEDIELLADEHPDLLEELRAVVCEDRGGSE